MFVLQPFKAISPLLDFLQAWITVASRCVVGLERRVRRCERWSAAEGGETVGGTLGSYLEGLHILALGVNECFQL